MQDRDVLIKFSTIQQLIELVEQTKCDCGHRMCVPNAQPILSRLTSFREVPPTAPVPKPTAKPKAKPRGK